MADNRKLYKEAVKVFGHAYQTEIAIKEFAAAIHEIQKHKQVLPCDVPEAIADVEIMCAQMRLIFPGVTDVKKQRLSRLQGLIRQRKDATYENKQTQA